MRDRFALLGPFLAVLAGGGAASCSSTSSGSSVIPPTLLTLLPSTFAGGVQCARLPGAWQSYVATLTDVTDPAKPSTLASSRPTPCSMPVSFGAIAPGRRYTASIDAYDRADIVPAGGAGSGSRDQLDPATGQVVAPRWRASCGALDSDAGVGGPGDASGRSDAADAWSPSGATMCVAYANVLIQDCSPLAGAQPVGDASVVIDTKAARGELECGDAAGQVASIRVVSVDSSLGERDIGCDEMVTYTPVAAGASLAFRLLAREAGASAPRWGAECVAVPKAGLAVPASCARLTDRGAVRVSMLSSLPSIGRACSVSDIATYRSVLVGAGLAAKEQACDVDTTFSPLGPGTYQIAVDARDAQGTVRLQAFCQGSVTPGATALAACDFGAASP
jgi:hypothetical protein